MGLGSTAGGWSSSSLTARRNPTLRGRSRRASSSSVTAPPLNGSSQQPAVGLTPLIVRLEHDPGDVLLRVDGLASRPTLPEPSGQAVDQGVELRLVVERSHNLVAAFVARRVVGVTPYDVAQQRVVVGVEAQPLVPVWPMPGKPNRDYLQDRRRYGHNTCGDENL